MGFWQIIYIGMMCMSVGMHLAKDGQPREGTYSFGTSFISLVIQLGILWAGGFFG